MRAPLVTDGAITRAGDRCRWRASRACPLSVPHEGPVKRTLAIVISAAVVGAIAGAAVGLAFSSRDSSEPPLELSVPTVSTDAAAPAHALSPEEIYREDAPGVVLITDGPTQALPPTSFTPPEQRQIRGLGSGFVVDERGDVVTNDQVVHGARRVRVAFDDGAIYAARLVGADPSTDVAVVQVNAPPALLHPLAFAPSSSVQVGDPAYAIGNPFGLEQGMTVGIVSALGRDIEAPKGLTIRNAVQTVAPIDHGNSGGPLLDRFGQVVGVNASTQGGTVDANVGVGFAIPSDTARSMTQELISSGHALHPWLGARTETLDARARGIPRLPAHGVLIVKVMKGSPAAKVGLRAATRQATVGGKSALVGGDVIIGVDDRSVTSSATLGDYVAGKKPGDRVVLHVVRGGKPLLVDVTLGSAPA